MDMQDNELDKLFRSALDDLEIEPSAQVWTGITDHLNANKRRRTLVPILSAAASVIVLIAVGVIFIPKTTKINDENPLANKTAKQSSVVKPLVAAKTNPVVIPVNGTNKSVAGGVIAPVSSIAVVKSRKIDKGKSPDKAPAAPEQKETIAKSSDQSGPVLAARDNDLINPAAPNGGDGMVAKPELNDVHIFESKTQLVVTQLPEISKSKPVAVKKHRIRSVGDIFNVVIAAVDKREDKIIEFSNTDEDDATITGVNLGIIKVKKEK